MRTDNQQAANTRAFLATYFRRKEMNEAFPEGNLPPPSYGADFPDSSDSVTLSPTIYSSDAPKAGQIRLLSGGRDMLTVLLYRFEENDEAWMVIPLSDYPFPATEMEATFRNPPEAADKEPRTYCLWGWFMYPEELIRYRSWLLDTINHTELKQIETLMLGYHAGQPIPEPLQQLCGIRIQMPSDPRLDYEEEALSLHESVLKEVPRLRFAVWFATHDTGPSWSPHRKLTPPNTCTKASIISVAHTALTTVSLSGINAHDRKLAAASSQDSPTEVLTECYRVPGTFPRIDRLCTLSLAMPLTRKEKSIAKGSPLPPLLWSIENAQDQLNGMLAVRLKQDGRLLGMCELLKDEKCIHFPGGMNAPYDLTLPNDLVLICSNNETSDND